MSAGVDEIDPTKTEDKIPTGANGGGDDSADWKFPESPDDTSAQKGKFPWPGGARPKDPYAYQEIPMSGFPKEQSGLLPPKGTAETSFIEGRPLGKTWTFENSQIENANLDLEQQYPEYGKNGKFLNLFVETVKLKTREKKDVVFVKGPRGGKEPLYTDKKQ